MTETPLTTRRLVRGAFYIHTQSAGAMTWNIQHNLGRNPLSVTLYDNNGNQVIGDVHPVDANNVQVNFAVAVAGQAYVI